ncbi:D,D-heptose 1,7-bisphosphate phosphatase [Fusobacterium gonidiaformans 3-1-5R]|uniref:D,D-heptose 1,7-bisphosphate phosphatase n=2 Tax=Fusobacterium TaxID=848 RepID=E5BHM7_9FUSO|nr:MULTISPECIES: D-glycero-beta-D-manno-heptose 1,7-bisphosphate 7-phosphatase [Fusobacterium]AVQ16246.1 D-glycero-beta-D-manno-heptose-1,7-bisphosphate 7-phosphatase [Fusobacterium gonidiaformans ATCC 25563]EFS22000.1 D,D-heptose 1,7-bisphosphate phosphatase [Fusobacterium gonidiaformans 3-1-5R]KXA15643.1 D,D-heptose 1,7-bisphosphate phosphatase [Fusobacterium equinum]
MKKAIFLDRDGTLNIEKEYLYQEKDLEFEKGVIEALSIFRDLGYLLIVVTNQSGIARNYYTEEDLEIFHQAFQRRLSFFGLKIDKFYYCPHHPEKGIGKYKQDCFCRKPKPGMLEKGIAEFDVDRNLSYMVGDKYADIQAGRAARISPILVRTGYGKEEEQKLQLGEAKVFDTLLAFAHYIKQRERL